MSFDQIRWDFVVVVQKEDVAAGRSFQARVSRGALTGPVQRDDAKRKAGKARFEVRRPPLPTGLVHDDDLVGGNRLSSELFEERQKVGIAVDSRNEDGDATCVGQAGALGRRAPICRHRWRHRKMGEPASRRHGLRSPHRSSKDRAGEGPASPPATETQQDEPQLILHGKDYGTRR